MGGSAQYLVLAGGVGAMGLLSLMLFLTRQRDTVPLWLGLFCVSLWLYFMLGPEHSFARASAFLALPFLALMNAALPLHPGKGALRVAAAFVVLGVAAALAAIALPRGQEAKVLLFMQVLAFAAAIWATLVGVQLAMGRRSGWPLLISTTAFGYPLLTLGVLQGAVLEQALAPLGLISFVLTPGIIVARRLTRYFDAEALRASNQAKFTSDLLDSVPVALAMRDPDGKYLFVNGTWESYFGVTRDAVIGTTPRNRMKDDDANAVLSLDRAALARGLGAPAQLLDFQIGGKRYMQSRTVMADSQGKTLGVLIASIDTTDRFAIEQALATEQRRMQLVVYAARVGILDWDGVVHSVYYSARFREILGHPADADTSKWPEYYELVHPDDAERVKASFREHILGRGPGGAQEIHPPIEYRLRRADGSYVWLEGVGVSVRDAKGYVTRFIASVSDISERRSYEEALRQSVRLREDVERMSRHDLKTPLNSIIAVPRLLREGRTLTSEDEQLLSIIERAGYRILNMVNLSLDLFRMEQGSYSFRPQAVDLVDMVQKVVDDLESQAASKNVAVRVVRVPHLAKMMAKGEDLLCYSMLANLLKNAIEASPEGEAVTVTIEQSSDGSKGMLLRVHNHGAVPESVRQNFFHKYSTAGKTGGLGLGTYSARLMARVQEGSIEMRTSESEGTTLTVRLAEAPAGTSFTERRVVSRTAGAGDVDLPDLPALDVMVVDDDEFNRLVMRRYLPSPPLNLAMAVNGRAALEAARKTPPDVIFLDLEMPVMTGYEAAERLRSDERAEGRKRAKIIAFSSNDDDATIRRALAAGCDHYLAKPAPRETLWSLLLSNAAPAARPAEGPAATASDPVEIDPDLLSSLPAFYASRRRALDSIAAALAADDRMVVKRQAHKLAGSFALYGFRWASAECRAIQLHALGADPASLLARVAAVRNHLDSIELPVNEPTP